LSEEIGLRQNLTAKLTGGIYVNGSLGGIESSIKRVIGPHVESKIGFVQIDLR
jgi:hypothetical protein